ncbi:DUF445 domain-containing protein [Stutzerimonas stutzeri]|uniref:DUF445 domain-containing protein n=1 Tax=Stutzerimonas stutzeri TaxID=316 RepID=A0A2N8SRJ7_STUST|nr:DUF445 domain-containing protein [Stutzerimonas stutzeri]MCQ4327198.1 DUF445 domain-containing protein [Stutzerimonas stutzeri]PNG05112.1 DUF445 domain-containing protein [Stutzerimonas stutzeri]
MRSLSSTWQSPVSRMKLVAGLLLLFAALLYVVATGLQAMHPAWGYVASFAEAAMVGAIADWFAVTALFRRPLGLPIPHTAIIPRSKARIGRSLSTFITTHFLATPLVLAKLAELDLAGRLAGWLRHPANAEAVGRRLAGVAHFGVAALHDERVRAFVQEKALGRLRRFDLAPPLAQALEVLTSQGRHQAMLDELLVRLDSIMQDEQTRALVADAISAEIRTLRYLGLSRPVGGWSANKFVDGLSALIAEVAADPGHLIRQRFDEHVGEYIERLRHDPTYALEVERILAQLLEHPATSRYFQSLWQELTDWLEQDLASDDSRIGRRIVALCRGLGDALAADDAMRGWINEQLMAAAPAMLERYRGQIGHYIAQRVENWESHELVERLEQSVGKDLQYIRINGTLVGGLVGLLLHALTRLLGG